ncbi:hypothetical protein DL95DRAFT_164960 [Leptodontidium sp. 2 PMI_412]|nr:hypothetical protein DL95DRAFT_164960 [Leptodontidium sp. 2 PMI_412]
MLMFYMGTSSHFFLLLLLCRSEIRKSHFFPYSLYLHSKGASSPAQAAQNFVFIGRIWINLSGCACRMGKGKSPMYNLVQFFSTYTSISFHHLPSHHSLDRLSLISAGLKHSICYICETFLYCT